MFLFLTNAFPHHPVQSGILPAKSQVNLVTRYSLAIFLSYFAAKSMVGYSRSQSVRHHFHLHFTQKECMIDLASFCHRNAQKQSRPQGPHLQTTAQT